MTTPPPDEPAGRADPFGPPAEPCECFCLHCRRVFSSGGMWFQPVVNGPPESTDGFWMCPTANCGGAGFTFDIFPTDPDHPANDGWSSDDGDEDEDDGGADEEDEYDPDEPRYAHLAEQEEPDGSDDIEGEEWKFGLEPGERPPDPPDVSAARAEWEAEQRKFDEPDRRPRSIDGSGWKRRDPPPPLTGDEIADDDIPF